MAVKGTQTLGMGLVVYWSHGRRGWGRPIPWVGGAWADPWAGGGVDSLMGVTLIWYAAHLEGECTTTLHAGAERTVAAAYGW